jgi:DNA helicase II / ATP-dependent DNA helicase PcrA
VTELPPFVPPTITEDDCNWACAVLGLPKTAFSGPDGKDPRLELLRSNETLDIEACPGSGKTTLLVAKLAILARKWTDRRSGICVLSHTNVARREIEQRLGSTAEGRRLLTYPHFVGTIHGFVNEYLAIPWLRSLGYPTNHIDNDHCEQHRRRLLGLKKFSALATYVNTKEAGGKLNIVSKWCVVSPAFEALKESGAPEFKDATGMAAKQLSALVAQCARDGYHRYDEMFMWARDLLDQIPEVRDAIRERFPLLFLDEVQDNSELQSALLFRLFVEGDTTSVRQRFGDSNQAIYHSARQTEGATTDPFPRGDIRKDIPNSHRFGQEIGNLADPLALEPQGLVGCGPSHKIVAIDKTAKHTIFLFDDSTVQHVISAYARYLLELFSGQELQRGIFTAVGGVHRRGGDDKLPRFVGHYWPDYDHELATAEPKPQTFQQYVTAGLSLARRSSESHYIVEKFAEGVLRLAGISNPLVRLRNRKRKHRYLLELLAEEPEFRATYLDLVMAIAAEGRNPTADEWNGKWSDTIGGLAGAIGGNPIASPEAKQFLEWRAPENGDQPTCQSRQRDNFFRYPDKNPMVQIRVGSIHSAKGETHTATLVLDTYYFEHHLATLKPWLLRQKSGKGSETVRNISRLKQHYVAMTRPSHLLCLAMREDAFTGEELAQLKSIPWRVARVTGGAPVWL